MSEERMMYNTERERVPIPSAASIIVGPLGPIIVMGLPEPVVAVLLRFQVCLVIWFIEWRMW